MVMGRHYGPRFYGVCDPIILSQGSAASPTFLYGVAVDPVLNVLPALQSLLVANQIRRIEPMQLPKRLSKILICILICIFQFFQFLICISKQLMSIFLRIHCPSELHLVPSSVGNTWFGSTVRIICNHHKISISH